MRRVVWRGDSRKRVRSFPEIVRNRIGLALFRVQSGAMPVDWKPMVGIGQGAIEIRVHHENEYRVIYANILESVVVLHAFVKKTEKTAQTDLKLAKQRLREVLQEIAYGTFNGK